MTRTNQGSTSHRGASRATARGLPLAVAAAVVAAATAARASPADRGPEKVLAVLSDMADSLKATRYQHVTAVRPRQGEYFFDCSGMAEWVLRRSAPQALRLVGRPEGRRPLAVHFFKRIARVPPGERRGAWYRVPEVAAAAPGDVLAWQRPPWFRSKSTGHVAFVLSEPAENPGSVPGYLIRIADATRYPHEDDSRGRGETGFGTGTILVATDQAGAPRGYGWYGSHSQEEWVVPCEMAIGRPLR